MYVNARAIIERQTRSGLEILVQVRDKPNQPKGLEFPGGRVEEFESIKAALYREVLEETGLKIKIIKGDINQRVYSNNDGSVEGLMPFFVYQTIHGPVDSIGFIFRCEVEEGEAAINEESYGHQWIRLAILEEMLKNTPDAFDFLTQGLLDYYCYWVKVNC
ncbi:NUDIX hydrolase [Fictibacillus barbaricus]|uniref:8-oxo-dGTP pyrophosphatase MutT (NUDIX family) n=1 Tax=Fictibacillus barbaricus TaxID=182136 RepID=A0ABU1TYZ0_9BACL|nr:NUDIX hydrolase [Fictibacillus barbaricus]MDR7072445.1 8-oxo-dGTP pyrophosphatase MutT (NUDIX family) [Fictibacillus barbaricus]